MIHSNPPRRIVLIALLLVALPLLLLPAASCRSGSEKPKFHPSRLAGQLYSGESLEGVERKLNMMDGSFDVVVDRAPLPGDTRPPYHLLVISKKNMKLYDQTGELTLTFFNDRLMTEQFYAENMAAAVRAVSAAEKISLTRGAAHIEPSTRVWVGKDENRRGYIGWIDKFLQAEQDAWLNRYESQPQE
jgi:hypothetical protein